MSAQARIQGVQGAAGLASEYDYVFTLRIEIPCSLLQGASIEALSAPDFYPLRYNFPVF